MEYLYLYLFVGIVMTTYDKSKVDKKEIEDLRQEWIQDGLGETSFHVVLFLSFGTVIIFWPLFILFDIYRLIRRVL